jgi:AcrR family transcriptional regulator
MGVKERRERQKVALRERILAVARELFVTEGYEAVSMRKIADRLEYSPTAIYLHFKDKEALIRELCDRDFLALAHEMQAIAAVADPIERLRAVGTAYLEFGLRYPNHYRLMFMTQHPPHRPEDSAIHRGNPDEDAYALLQTTVREAFIRKQLVPEVRDPELLAQTLWAGIHGIVSLHITKKATEGWIQFKPAAETAAFMMQLLFDGILVAPGGNGGNGKKAGR